MNILRFPTSVPMEVALASPQGTLVQGRYGDRMKFDLTDGQVMYVPPIVANKIEAEGIVPGEPFELCKAQVKTGQRRSIEWSVKRLDPERARVGEASAVTEAPEKVNADAYGNWFYKLKPASAGAAGKLLDAAAYTKLIESA